MDAVMKIDSFPKFLSFILIFFSLFLLGYGFFSSIFWSGFGIVLLMTSLILVAVLSGPQMHSESNLTGV